MTIVNFTHCDYYTPKGSKKLLSTTAENWIKYDLFDATDAQGETWPIYKDCCKLIDTEEI